MSSEEKKIIADMAAMEIATWFQAHPVRAFMVTYDNYRNHKEWPEWLHKAFQKNMGTPGALWVDKVHLGENRLCITCEDRSVKVIRPGQWIVQDSQEYLHRYSHKRFSEMFYPVR